ncbi:hypothetical protein [Microvirga antarctica]|uniref:hypothetical protein n=1 Tax=Microvirga antarctica TaxID=2819233 RepID=UPI001B300425|nr:hypothetical protein [Microvirga antarctica]
MSDRKAQPATGTKTTDREPVADSHRLDGAEANATMREVWDEPGGEAYAFRQAIQGNNRDEDHSALTAAETPETTRHLSDASLTPEEKQAMVDAATGKTPPKKGG